VPGRRTGFRDPKAATTREAPDVSVVVPVFNEEQHLEPLHDRITRALEGAGERYEVIYVDDGSSDRSLELLSGFVARDPRVRVVEFSRNAGQHAAVLAGFEESRGRVVVTLDADLQNPPEEIPKLLAAIRAGNDVAGGWRTLRQDSLFRRLASGVINRLTSKALGVRMKDYGCMLRAYRREVVDGVVRCGEASAFIPALANTFAKRIVEVPVAHEERLGSRSRYGLIRLVNLQFDLVTGFSHLPLKVISTTGILVALAGLGFGLFLLVRRLIVGPEVEGVFTLFAILFVLVGAQFLALGVLGEYVGRVYREVRRRPRFVIRKVWRAGDPEA